MTWPNNRVLAKDLKAGDLVVTGYGSYDVYRITSIGKKTVKASHEYASLKTKFKLGEEVALICRDGVYRSYIYPKASDYFELSESRSVYVKKVNDVDPIGFKMYCITNRSIGVVNFTQNAENAPSMVPVSIDEVGPETEVMRIWCN